MKLVYKRGLATLATPKGEYQQLRRTRLVTLMLAHEVSIPLSDPFDVAWLRENVGQRRSFYPMFEAMTGYMDFHDGDWAYEHDGNRRYVWFSRTHDMVKFMIFFGGRASKHDDERRNELLPPS